MSIIIVKLYYISIIIVKLFLRPTFWVKFKEDIIRNKKKKIKRGERREKYSEHLMFL